MGGRRPRASAGGPRRRFVPQTRPVEGRHQAYSQTIEGKYHFDRYSGGGGVEEMFAAYRSVTAELQAIIAEAVSEGKELRAHGSEWSLSRAGLARDRLVNSKLLRLLRFRFTEGSVLSAYRGDPRRLRFLECGESISVINRHLFREGLSLKASGSNDGQTLVGAMSTGTHGSAIGFGAIPDFVAGLHVVVGPGRHVYLERASSPVLKSAFAERKLGAEVIRDDDVFNAALVSFGSFGIIQGALIEARELFALHSVRFFHPWDGALRSAATTLDFSGIDLSRAPLPPGTPTHRPYHFQLYFNPNEGTPPERASVLMMFEDEWSKVSEGYRTPVWGAGEPGPGASALELVGSIFDLLPSPLDRLLVPEVNRMIEQRMRASYTLATLGDMFRGEQTRGRLQVTGTALPMDRCVEALEIAFKTYRDLNRVLPVIISSRFVPGSRALLGFTRFERSCTLELDTIRTDDSETYLRRVRENLEAAGIPFTCHWGKLETYLTPARVRAMYGPALDRWVEVRRDLLENEDVRRVFTNDFMRRLGLG